jgi:hypothetical protein
LIGSLGRASLRPCCSSCERLKITHTKAQRPLIFTRVIPRHRREKESAAKRAEQLVKEEIEKL